MKTVERYDWKFDEIPGSYLSTKYYDELERRAVPDGQTTNVIFPSIDSRSIIEKWGFVIGEPLPQPYELIYDWPNLINISLRINNSGVSGYSGKDFSINSFVATQPPPGTTNIHQTAQNLVFNVNLWFPVTENNTRLLVRVINNAGIALRIHSRIRGKYID